MENASKALIIAGAILISILLISLGILIYNQATNITNGNQMSEVDITTFNQKFIQYEGEKVTGAQVKSLLQQVVASNSNEENSQRPIEVDGNSGATVSSGGKQITGSNSIKNSSRYSVTVTYSESGNNAGLVNKITINNAASST